MSSMLCVEGAEKSVVCCSLGIRFNYLKSTLHLFCGWVCTDNDGNTIPRQINFFEKNVNFCGLIYFYKGEPKFQILGLVSKTCQALLHLNIKTICLLQNILMKYVAALSGTLSKNWNCWILWINVC